MRLFEIARVFLKRGEAVEQPERVAGLAYGGRLPEQWGAKSERVDFYDVKGRCGSPALFACGRNSARPATGAASGPARPTMLLDAAW